VNRPTEDIGESIITLRDEAARQERRFYIRLGAVVLLAVLAYLIWRIVEPLWQPLLWAVLLGSLLAPANARLARRLGNRPRLASAITTLLTVLLFMLPVGIITGAVAGQAAQLLQKLDSQVPAATKAPNLNLGEVEWLRTPLGWIERYANVSIVQIQDWLVAGAKHLLQVLMSSGGSFVLGALGTLVSFMLMLFVLFFVLRDGPAVSAGVVRMLPIPERRRMRLWRHLVDVTRAVFMGIGLTALLQGILVGVGFWIAGLPSPLVFGVLAVLFALVPVVGTIIVWAPGALYLATHGHYGHAVFLALWGMVAVGSVDNFLRPILISGRAEVPTLAVFVGVMGGLSAFGFIGLFLGPIVLGLLVALFRFQLDELDGRTKPGHEAAHPGGPRE
jgi:predicted PurR-regulated permease PerM